MRFSADQLQAAIQAIAGITGAQRASGRADRIKRLAGRLRALLDYGQVDEIMADGLRPYLASIRRQCEQIDAAIYQSYISYPIDVALASG